MQPVTLTQGQIHLLNMASHIKTEKSLDMLKEQLSKFYAALIDIEMDELWDSGIFNQQKLNELRGKHLRTKYE